MTDPTDTLDQDARTWRAMRLGEELLVPKDVHRQGPRAVIAAALRRIADIRRPRARGLHHSAAQKVRR